LILIYFVIIWFDVHLQSIRFCESHARHKRLISRVK
jgi:hypothetical protein